MADRLFVLTFLDYLSAHGHAIGTLLQVEGFVVEKVSTVLLEP